MPGPTSGAATTFATTPTRLTCPEMAVTTGWVASCAAIGTVTASASHRGAHASSPAHRSAHRMIPALAQTDSTNPTDRHSHGSTSNRPTTAHDRYRSPCRAPPQPSAASPTTPIAAARSTLGSARQSSTNATTPTTATPRRHQPVTPNRAATHSIAASSRVRFAPETAARCSSPVLRKSACRSAVISSVSPTTRAGTSARGPCGRPATESRSPCRTADTARSSGDGPATSSGDARARAHATTGSSTAAGSSRTAARTVAPAGTAAQAGARSPEALSRTIAPDTHATPLPSTPVRVASVVQIGPPRPTSEVWPLPTRTSTTTTAPCRAHSGIGPRPAAQTRSAPIAMPASSTAAAVTTSQRRRHQPGPPTTRPRTRPPPDSHPLPDVPSHAPSHRARASAGERQSVRTAADEDPGSLPGGRGGTRPARSERCRRRSSGRSRPPPAARSPR